MKKKGERFHQFPKNGKKDKNTVQNMIEYDLKASGHWKTSFMANCELLCRAPEY